MTDEQVLTAAIAIIVPVSALIYSNSRVTDVRRSVDEAKETLRAEMQTMKSEIIKEFQTLRTELITEIHALRTEVKSALEEVRTAVKIHELEHHK